MDGLDGSLGLVEYRAPYGANKFVLNMGPNVSFVSSEGGLVKRPHFSLFLTLSLNLKNRRRESTASTSVAGTSGFAAHLTRAPSTSSPYRLPLTHSSLVKVLVAEECYILLHLPAINKQT